MGAEERMEGALSLEMSAVAQSVEEATAREMAVAEATARETEMDVSAVATAREMVTDESAVALAAAETMAPVLVALVVVEMRASERDDLVVALSAAEGARPCRLPPWGPRRSASTRHSWPAVRGIATPPPCR